MNVEYNHRQISAIIARVLVIIWEYLKGEVIAMYRSQLMAHKFMIEAVENRMSKHLQNAMRIGSQVNQLLMHSVFWITSQIGMETDATNMSVIANETMKMFVTHLRLVEW